MEDAISQGICLHLQSELVREMSVHQVSVHMRAGQNTSDDGCLGDGSSVDDPDARMDRIFARMDEISWREEQNRIAAAVIQASRANMMSASTQTSRANLTAASSQTPLANMTSASNQTPRANTTSASTQMSPLPSHCRARTPLATESPAEEEDSEDVKEDGKKEKSKRNAAAHSPTPSTASFYTARSRGSDTDEL